METEMEKNLETIWNALQAYREDLISEGEEMHDKEWDEITYAMARITEELGLDGYDNA